MKQNEELSLSEKINFCCKASFAIARGIDLISIRSSGTTRLATTASVAITGIEAIESQKAFEKGILNFLEFKMNKLFSPADSLQVA